MRPRRSFIVSSSLLLAGSILLSGCTSDEEKVGRLVTTQLDKCKASKVEDVFFEASVTDGKDEVLRDACLLEMQPPKLVDEFHATVSVGPYDWLAGVDSDSGVWVLSQVDWEAMDRIRRMQRESDPPADARERVVEHFDAAAKAVPESEWIHVERLKNLLELRKKQRGKSKDPVGLGAPGQAAFDSLKAWGVDGHADAGARGRLMVIAHYKRHKSKTEMALEGVGGQDEWLQSLIDQAKKDKNADDEKKYRAELKQRQEERPKIEAEIRGKLEAIQSRLCKEVGELSPAHAKSEDMKKEVGSVKASIQCDPKPATPPAKPSK